MADFLSVVSTSGFGESLRRHNECCPLLFRRFFGFFAFGHDFGEIGDRGKFFQQVCSSAKRLARTRSSSTMTITLSKNDRSAGL